MPEETNKTIQPIPTKLNSNDSPNEIKPVYLVINLIAGLFIGFIVFLVLGFLSFNLIFDVSSEFGVVPIFDLENPILGLTVILISVLSGLFPLGRYLTRKYKPENVVMSMILLAVVITILLVVSFNYFGSRDDGEIMEITPRPVDTTDQDR